MEIYDLKQQTTALYQQMQAIVSKKDPQSIAQEIDKLETESAAANFWQNAQSAQGVMRNLGRLKQELEELTNMASRVEDIYTNSKDLTEADQEMADILEIELQQVTALVGELSKSFYQSRDKRVVVLNTDQFGQGQL